MPIQNRKIKLTLIFLLILLSISAFSIIGIVVAFNTKKDNEPTNAAGCSQHASCCDIRTSLSESEYNTYNYFHVYDLKPLVEFCRFKPTYTFENKTLYLEQDQGSDFNYLSYYEEYVGIFYQFAGKFYGQGHSISAHVNVGFVDAAWYINDRGYQTFHWSENRHYAVICDTLLSGGLIRDIEFTSCTLWLESNGSTDGTGDVRAGIIAVKVNSGATIQSCIVKGATITSDTGENAQAGFLVYENGGTVKNCYLPGPLYGECDDKRSYLNSATPIWYNYSTSYDIISAEIVTYNGIGEYYQTENPDYETLSEAKGKLKECSSNGGPHSTENNNTDWYEHSEYNSGNPCLRAFISWKDVEIYTTLGNSRSDVVGTINGESRIELKVPTSVALSATTATTAKLTIYGTEYTAQANSGYGFESWSSSGSASGATGKTEYKAKFKDTACNGIRIKTKVFNSEGKEISGLVMQLEQGFTLDGEYLKTNTCQYNDTSNKLYIKPTNEKVVVTYGTTVYSAVLSNTTDYMITAAKYVKNSTQASFDMNTNVNIYTNVFEDSEGYITIQIFATRGDYTITAEADRMYSLEPVGGARSFKVLSGQSITWENDSENKILKYYIDNQLRVSYNLGNYFSLPDNRYDAFGVVETGTTANKSNGYVIESNLTINPYLTRIMYDVTFNKATVDGVASDLSKVNGETDSKTITVTDCWPGVDEDNNKVLFYNKPNDTNDHKIIYPIPANCVFDTYNISATAASEVITPNFHTTYKISFTSAHDTVENKGVSSPSSTTEFIVIKDTNISALTSADGTTITYSFKRANGSNGIVTYPINADLYTISEYFEGKGKDVASLTVGSDLSIRPTLTHITYTVTLAQTTGDKKVDASRITISNVLKGSTLTIEETTSGYTRTISVKIDDTEKATYSYDVIYACTGFGVEGLTQIEGKAEWTINSNGSISPTLQQTGRWVKFQSAQICDASGNTTLAPTPSSGAYLIAYNSRVDEPSISGKTYTYTVGASTISYDLGAREGYALDTTTQIAANYDKDLNITPEFKKQVTVTFSAAYDTTTSSATSISATPSEPWTIWYNTTINAVFDSTKHTLTYTAGENTVTYSNIPAHYSKTGDFASGVTATLQGPHSAGFTIQPQLERAKYKVTFAKTNKLNETNEYTASPSSIDVPHGFYLKYGIVDNGNKWNLCWYVGKTSAPTELKSTYVGIDDIYGISSYGHASLTASVTSIQVTSALTISPTLQQKYVYLVFNSITYNNTTITPKQGGKALPENIMGDYPESKDISLTGDSTLTYTYKKDGVNQTSITYDISSIHDNYRYLRTNIVESDDKTTITRNPVLKQVVTITFDKPYDNITGNDINISATTSGTWTIWYDTAISAKIETKSDKKVITYTSTNYAGTAVSATYSNIDTFYSIYEFFEGQTVKEGATTDTKSDHTSSSTIKPVVAHKTITLTFNAAKFAGLDRFWPKIGSATTNSSVLKYTLLYNTKIEYSQSTSATDYVTTFSVKIPEETIVIKDGDMEKSGVTINYNLGALYVVNNYNAVNETLTTDKEITPMLNQVRVWLNFNPLYIPGATKDNKDYNVGDTVQTRLADINTTLIWSVWTKTQNNSDITYLSATYKLGNGNETRDYVITDQVYMGYVFDRDKAPTITIGTATQGNWANENVYLSPALIQKYQRVTFTNYKNTKASTTYDISPEISLGYPTACLYSKASEAISFLVNLEIDKDKPQTITLDDYSRKDKKIVYRCMFDTSEIVITYMVEEGYVYNNGTINKIDKSITDDFTCDIEACKQNLSDNYNKTTDITYNGVTYEIYATEIEPKLMFKQYGGSYGGAQ